MKILLLGGNGNIGWNVLNKALGCGHDVQVLQRKKESFTRRSLPENIDTAVMDVNDFSAVDMFFKKNHFDIVVDFLCYTEDHASFFAQTLRNKVSHYIYISTTAVYKRPHLGAIAESHEVGSDWEYARNKRKCEEVFLSSFIDHKFPVTIVRPSHTYDTIIPVAIGPSDWTIPQRMIDGKPIPLLNNGVWTVTHAADLAAAIVGLFGREEVFGEVFHVTSDTPLTWLEIMDSLYNVLNIHNKNYVYVDMDTLQHCLPKKFLDEIVYHKQWPDVYDNTKIKRCLPDWEASVSLGQGLEQTVAWYQEDARHIRVNSEFDRILSQMCCVGCDNAR